MTRKSSGGGAGGGRRQAYAEMTRRAIIDAARRLFIERGFFATTVDQIAAEADVAPATVYAVSGGKQGLLRTLVEELTAHPAGVEALDRILEVEEPAGVIRMLAAIARALNEEFMDVVTLTLATAPHDKDAAESLDRFHRVARDRVGRVGRRLEELGALRDGLGAEEAADILWFYFGYMSFSILTRDNGWSFERAEHWLAAEAIHALL